MVAPLESHEALLSPRVEAALGREGQPNGLTYRETEELLAATGLPSTGAAIQDVMEKYKISIL